MQYIIFIWIHRQSNVLWPQETKVVSKMRNPMHLSFDRQWQWVSLWSQWVCRQTASGGSPIPADLSAKNMGMDVASCWISWQNDLHGSTYDPGSRSLGLYLMIHFWDPQACLVIRLKVPILTIVGMSVAEVYLWFGSNRMVLCSSHELIRINIFRSRLSNELNRMDSLKTTWIVS